MQEHRHGEVQPTAQGEARRQRMRARPLRRVRGEEDDLPAPPAPGGLAGARGLTAGPIVHRLQIYPGPFREIKKGDQRFVLHEDDAPYDREHHLLLQEYAPEDARYTGDELEVLVTHLIRHPREKCPRGLVVMSIAPISLAIQVKGDLQAERYRRDGQGTERL